MGFKRYGMNGAQPTFCVGSIMKPAAELVEFAVGDKGVRGFEAAKTDASVYRYDVSGIDHPDARLIAAAPDLLEALTGIVDRMGATESDDGHKDIWRAAFDAIRRATGAA